MEDQTPTLFDLPDEKIAALEELLREAHSDAEQRSLVRILGCGNFHVLLWTGAGFEIVPMVCGSRWCEKCSTEKSRTMAKNLSVQFSAVESLKIPRVRYSDLRHFVFTCQSVRYCSLKILIKKYKKFIRRLTKVFQQDESLYLWKIEITFKAETCHPHIHVAVNKYYPINYLHALFKKHIRPFVSTIKFGKRVECSLYEFTKYTTKPSSWKKLNPKHFHYVFDAFYRARVIGISRHFRLMPEKKDVGWELIGCLEKIMNDPTSEFYGVAWSIYEEKIKGKKN